MMSPRLPACCILIITLLLAPFAAQAANELRNELSNHPSPYLAMHGEDPVHWQDWGARVLARARKSGKLIFISSGYFSCHWCHVMQRESYRDTEIADILNRSFIPVKLDRELEPVLDGWLMEFLQETRGRGGWPLNVFITPRGHPLIGTLYMPPATFKAFVIKLEQRWDRERRELSSLASEAAESMRRRRQATQSPVLDVDTKRLKERLLSQTLESADELAGGFGHQAKFPLAPKLAALMEYYRRYPSQRLREFLTLTLNQMMRKGLYDHLGGGFFRYTVDPYWQVPHFEKMLYDNAQLVQVYLLAAELFSEPEFERAGLSALDFMLDEMTTDDGAFVAALSAVDEQGREGGYYLWVSETLETALGAEEYRIVKMAWGLDRVSEFELGYLPLQLMSTIQIAEAEGKDESHINAVLNVARQKLLTIRAQRVLPIDDKLLSSWNGLALTALAEGALRYPGRYTRAAKVLRDFIIAKFWRDQSLMHALDREGNALGPGILEDYSNISRGLLSWASVSGHAEDYRITAEIVAQAWNRFHTDQGWRMTQTSLLADQPMGIHIVDSHTPSPSATLLGVSLEVFNQPALQPYRKQIRQNLVTISSGLAMNPFAYASHVALLSRQAREDIPTE